MLATVHSCAITGLDGVVVDVEADISNGLPAHTVVGLPDTAVQEARERTRSAIRNSGAVFPDRRVTVNLAPADIRKEGPVYDLPMAVSTLAASGQLEGFDDSQAVYLGELSLDGGVRHTHGILPMVAAARDAGVDKAFVPAVDGAEAAVVEGISVYPVESLQQLIAHYMGLIRIEPLPVTEMSTQSASYPVDFADVRGHEHAKRALEVAAAGAHNVLLIGPPGSGKSLLARRLPSILPDMGTDEAIETSKIHSVAGLLHRDQALVAMRPYRSPHHSTSDAGLIGGGTIPGPGEVSLAHNGVLFLDELPEFRRSVLEVLRQPLEDGQVTIARASMALTFPARFMLAAAMNPCPCGYSTDPQRDCQCTAQQLLRYSGRVSGPLLDRIDLHIEVPPVKYADLASRAGGEPSAAVRERVNAARQRQLARFAGSGIPHNAAMGVRTIRQYCRLDAGGERLLERAMQRFGLSARAHDRIRKVARTIADLAGADDIGIEHLSEAVQYRTLDRQAG